MQTYSILVAAENINTFLTLDIHNGSSHHWSDSDAKKICQWVKDNLPPPAIDESREYNLIVLCEDGEINDIIEEDE